MSPSKPKAHFSFRLGMVDGVRLVWAAGTYRALSLDGLQPFQAAAALRGSATVRFAQNDDGAGSGSAPGLPTNSATAWRSARVSVYATVIIAPKSITRRMRADVIAWSAWRGGVRSAG